MQELTLKQLYIELDTDPDLRRLGAYKVVHSEGKPILPIDVHLEGKDIHLGEGDFRETFTAFDKTVARSLDLGDSVFTEIYLDHLQVDTLKFSRSKSSRLFFDAAKVRNCEFGEFKSSEVYFDWSNIENIFLQKLSAGIVYLGTLKAENVDRGDIRDGKFRFYIDPGGTESFGDFVVSGAEKEFPEDKEKEIRKLTRNELVEELKANPDLRRLGRYEVLPEAGEEKFKISIDLDGSNVMFGEGDFSRMSVSLGDNDWASVNFGSSIFSELSLSSLKADRIDFANSQAGELFFDVAKLGECFLSNYYGYKFFGGQADVEVLFGEGADVKDMSLESMQVGQFHVNHIKAEELRLGKSRIREMSMSAEKGVQKLYCEESKLELLNLHESHLKELHFGDSEIRKALINKCSVGTVRCDNLKAEVFYIGNDGKNELGLIDFERAKGIKRIEMERILPYSGSNKTDERHIFSKLSFGEDPEEKLRELRTSRRKR